MCRRTRLVAIVVFATLAVVLTLGACSGSADPVPVVNTGEDDQQNDTDTNDPSDPQDNTPEGEDRPDGAACSADDDCANETCLDSAEWPDGYCSNVHCEDHADCVDGNHDSFCLSNPQGNDFCARACDPTDTDPCRNGYGCLTVPGGDADGWCGPQPDDYDPTANGDDGGDGGDDGGDDNGGTGDPDAVDLDIQCESVSGFSSEFEFEVSAEADSYLVVPFSANGEAIGPEGITTPSGNYIDFENDHPYLLAGAQLFGMLNPTRIPAAPQYANQVESGTHTYHIPTNDDEICYYVVEDPSSSTALDINLYLVGVPGVDASTADTDSDIQSMIGHTDSILQQVGIELGEVRYYDVPDEAEQQYSIIRSREDVHQLAAYSQTPGDGVQDLRSVNVFLTEQFSMSDGTGAIGMSLGIPGAAALHETAFSGVAMTAEHLGGFGGAEESAEILAHEVGHFMGLFHTTEQGGQSASPLQDVPQCSNLSNPTSCPDWGNLMFPMAGSDGAELTDDQGSVLEANPLTY